MPKIKEGFLLREVAGNVVVVPIGTGTVDFNGLVTLNETGKLLWERLSCGCEVDALVKDLLDKYEIDAKTAEADVNSFVNKLKEAGLLEQPKQ